MENSKVFKIIINTDTEKEQSIEMDERFFDYARFTNRDARSNPDEPMRLSQLTSLRPLKIAKEFMELQKYQPSKVIKCTPINSDNFRDLVTHEDYFTFFKSNTGVM